MRYWKSDIRKGDVCTVLVNEWACRIESHELRLDQSAVRLISAGSIAIVLDISDGFADVAIAGVHGRWFIRVMALERIPKGEKS